MMPKYSLDVREIQKVLNGFLCLFKPPDVGLESIKNRLIKTICQQCNEMYQGEVPKKTMPIVEPHRRTSALVVIGQRNQLDYSWHPLVVGKIFQPEDFHIEPLMDLGTSSSGVCLLGMNDACDKLKPILDRAWINEYHIDGEFGRQNTNHDIHGKIEAKAVYDDVTKYKMDKLLTRLRFEFKRASLEFMNVHPQSQEAYDVARQGVSRPRVQGTPLIYDIDLMNFHLPYFRIRLQVTGENDNFLRSLIHEIGCSLETLACPRKIRRTRQGIFGLNHALLLKHLQLETTLKHILMCNKLVEKAMSKNPNIVEKARKEDIEDDDLLLEKYRLKDDLELESLGEEERDCVPSNWGREYNELPLTEDFRSSSKGKNASRNQSLLKGN